jgi:hypothetical protein
MEKLLSKNRGNVRVAGIVRIVLVGRFFVAHQLTIKATSSTCATNGKAEGVK